MLNWLVPDYFPDSQNCFNPFQHSTNKERFYAR